MSVGEIFDSILYTKFLQCQATVKLPRVNYKFSIKDWPISRFTFGGAFTACIT